MVRWTLGLLAGAFALAAGPASACLEIVTKKSEARAFDLAAHLDFLLIVPVRAAR